MFLVLFREEICIGKQFSRHSSDPSLLEQCELSLAMFHLHIKLRLCLLSAAATQNLNC